MRRGQRDIMGQVCYKLRKGLRSYTPEYSTGIMDKSQRMGHGRERGDVNMGRWLTVCSITAGPKQVV